jgi:hypothetical protein
MLQVDLLNQTSVVALLFLCVSFLSTFVEYITGVAYKGSTKLTQLPLFLMLLTRAVHAV